MFTQVQDAISNDSVSRGQDIKDLPRFLNATVDDEQLLDPNIIKALEEITLDLESELPQLMNSLLLSRESSKDFILRDSLVIELGDPVAAKTITEIAPQHNHLVDGYEESLATAAIRKNHRTLVVENETKSFSHHIGSINPASITNETVIITVDTTADEVNNNAFTSLREAIRIANSNPGPKYTIQLQSGAQYNLTLNQTIWWGNGTSKDGDLDILSDAHVSIEVIGGDAKAIINADTLQVRDRVLHVHERANLSLNNVVVTGGKTDEGGGGILVEQAELNLTHTIVTENEETKFGGGGIYIKGRNVNPAVLIIHDSIISENSATSNVGGGAGIRAIQATVDIGSSLIHGNVVEKDAYTSTVFGGGAYFSDFSQVNIYDTSITNNISHSGAGLATFNNTPITIDGSFIGFNVAESNGGGGSFLGSSSTLDNYDNIITDSFFEGNQARVGGGANIDGQTFIGGNSTFMNNGAASGGAAAIAGNSHIEQAIFANNYVEGIQNLGEGGAITYGAGGEHELLYVQFNNNNATTGGAVAVGKFATRDYNTHLTIIDSDFNGNEAIRGAHLENIYGSVDIFESTFFDGQASYAGAIYVDERGNTSISGSSFSGNEADSFGGAIFNNDGTLTVDFTEFTSNIANEGGAVHNNGDATIAHSLFTLNQARDALSGNTIFEGKGSVLFAGSGSNTNLSNSTLSHNKQSGDGVIYVDGSIIPFHPEAKVTLKSNTIVNNQGDFDLNGNDKGTGGVHIFPGDQNLDREPGTLYAYNNIIAQNINGANESNGDIFGPVTEARNNLIGNGTNGQGITDGIQGNIVGTKDNLIDPLIGPLADNGGQTKTHAVLVGSPAIDAGNNSFVVSNTDQRGEGFDRIVGGILDIGAYEVQEQENFTSNNYTAQKAIINLLASANGIQANQIGAEDFAALV